MTELEGQPSGNTGELDGRQLDEALARAMGWTLVDSFREQWAVPGRAFDQVIPRWHASLDALLRDIEPVCRERGMADWRLETYARGSVGFAFGVRGESGYGYSLIAATALARAFLAVLTRGEM
jgi:hypothetical protein